MENFDLAINNGLVVNSTHKAFANLGVKDGKISILSDEPISAKHVIDAKGKWVIPGVVDTHVHFALRQGQGEDGVLSEDDYETGPIASAVGGVTTFVDYAICPQKMKLKSFLDERINLADNGSCIDYSFHCGITNTSPEVLEEIPGIVEMGIPSFKFFMTYKKWGFAVDLGFLWGVFNTLKELNGIACLHCEQDDIIEYLRNKYKDERSMEYFGSTRPDFSEEITVAEAAILAREAGSRLHIVHLTTEKALNVIRKAKAEGVKIRTETCPQYLFCSEEDFKREDGYLYTMTPPLRAKSNSEALWKGLLDGSIGILTSDHNAFGKAVKEKLSDWMTVPPGLGGSEMNLTFLHSEGVVKRNMTPERMVELLSTGPAEEFGVAGKGRLEVGYDADLVIFNPDRTKRVTFSDLATPGGFTIYEGTEMQGWPEMTISRGEVIVEDRKFIGKTGRGHFIKRNIDPTKN
jgi:dihydropyrimidinase